MITHEIADEDNTDFSAVVLCTCGASFLGTGEARATDAREQHKAHGGIVWETPADAGSWKVDPEQVRRELPALWASGASCREIGVEFGVTPGRVSQLRKRMGLPPRQVRN